MKWRKIMNRKIIITTIIGAVLIVSGVSFALKPNQPTPNPLQTVLVKPVSNTISAQGSIHSVSEATLHFQTGGKVVYLPFKEGDAVTQGQIIAQQDTYALQQQLTQALNTYRSTRDTFDQQQENAQNGNLQGQQKTTLNTYVTSPVTNTDVINSIVKRVLDQNQATLDNSVISVQLANNALSLATLTAPFSGVITHEDISVPNVNVTTSTSFSLADPSTPVFKAQVLQSDIDFVSVGATATIKLNGNSKSLKGTVTKIYPDKVTTPSGEAAYTVDISSPDLLTQGKLSQSGIVLITSSAQQATVLVPLWTVVGHQAIWIMKDNQPVLTPVTLGKTHGSLIEVLSGLSQSDSVITNPQTIAKMKYTLL
ncbi:MAG TPA: efflux RND transporter periplasmic adaptor subunit [Patescibacteria group bacterium]|nr:efflux RND transporter periplasmic adaptor subunit [Patescibacteria group bacterium]